MNQGQSEHTEEKEYGLGKVLSQWLSVVDRIVAKYKITSPVLYVDMNAGAGWNEEVNCIGSPLLFLSESEKHDFKKEIYFLDSSANSVVELGERILEAEPRDMTSCHLIVGDHHESLPGIIDKHRGYGLIYHDPNGLPSFDLLREIYQRPNTGKLDILIRISGTNYKRIRNGVDSLGKKKQISDLIGKYPNLKDQLKSINKKQWIVRDIIDPDPYQWTFLLGTNFVDFKAWESQGFYKIESSKGAAILNRISYTVKELGDF
jgi:three-Cys-motif partner protein